MDMKNVIAENTNNKLNQNLMNILHTIVSEKELITGKRADEAELAKLQYEYFAKKLPDPEIDKIKLVILNGLKGVANKMTEEFTKLQNSQVCAELLDQMYADKEIAKTDAQLDFIGKLKKLISSIKIRA